jgi:hypothetical protein
MMTADLEYMVLDMSLPAILRGIDGYFYNHGEWKWVCSGDLYHNARSVSKADFDRMFGELPPLPEA